MYGKIAGLYGNDPPVWYNDNPVENSPDGGSAGKRQSFGIFQKRASHMAKCEHCGKTTQFGQNRPWSKKATKRTFKPNLQKVTVYEDGKKIRKTLCTRCIRTLTKV